MAMRIEGNDQRLAAATAAQMLNSGTQQVIAPKTSQQQEASAVSNGNKVQTLMGDKVSIKIDLPKNTVETLQKMGNISDFINSVAINLRQTNEGITAVNDIVEQMKASLDKIIKNYPPFPPESRDRMEMLMSYSSLQKQIMSMMVPPPPQPVMDKVQQLWGNLTNGQTTVQTPTLSTDAPDTHVKAAAQQLDAVSSQLNLVQEALGASVKSA
jgi:hypothetical protein